MATDATPPRGTELPTRPSEPADAKAPIEPMVSEDPPANDPPVGAVESDTPGHVALLRRRLLELLDEHDET